MRSAPPCSSLVRFTQLARPGARELCGVVDAVLVQVGSDARSGGMDADSQAGVVGGSMTGAKDTDGDVVKGGHSVKINDESVGSAVNDDVNECRTELAGRPLVDVTAEADGDHYRMDLRDSDLHIAHGTSQAAERSRTNVTQISPPGYPPCASPPPGRPTAGDQLGVLVRTAWSRAAERGPDY